MAVIRNLGSLRQQIARAEQTAQDRLSSQAEAAQSQIDIATRQTELENKQIAQAKGQIGAQATIRTASLLERQKAIENISKAQEQVSQKEKVIGSARESLESQVTKAREVIKKAAQDLGEGPIQFTTIKMETIPAQKLGPPEKIRIDTIPAQKLPPIRVVDFTDKPGFKASGEGVWDIPSNKLIQASRVIPPTREAISAVAFNVLTLPTRASSSAQQSLDFGSRVFDRPYSQTAQDINKLSQTAVEFIDPSEKELNKLAKAQEDLNRQVIDFNSEFTGKELGAKEFELAEEKSKRLEAKQLEIDAAKKNIEEERKLSFFKADFVPQAVVSGGARGVARASQFATGLYYRPFETTKGVLQPVFNPLGFAREVVTDPLLIGEIGATALIFSRASKSIQTKVKTSPAVPEVPGTNINLIKKVGEDKFAVAGAEVTIQPGTIIETKKFGRPTETTKTPPRIDVAQTSEAIILDKKGDIISGGVVTKKVSPGGVAGKPGPTTLYQLTTESGTKPIPKDRTITPLETSLLSRGQPVTRGKVTRSFIELNKIARFGKDSATVFRPGSSVRRVGGVGIAEPVTKNVIATKTISAEATKPTFRITSKKRIVVSEGVTFILENGKVIGEIDSFGNLKQLSKTKPVPKAVLKKAQQIQQALPALLKKKPTIPKKAKSSAPTSILKTEAKLTTTTSLGLASDQKTTQETQQAQRLTSRTSSSLVSDQELQQEGTAQIPTLDTTQTFVPSTRTNQDERLASALLSGQDTVQIQQTEQIQGADITFGTPTPPPPKTPITPTGFKSIPLPNPSPARSALNKLRRTGSRTAYDVFVKTKGKFRKVGNDLPLGVALKKGATVTKEGTESTFEVRRDKKARTQMRDIPFRPNPNTFRNYQVKKGKRVSLPSGPDKFVYIEKKRKRLTTRSETKSLVSSRRRTGGLFG